MDTFILIAAVVVIVILVIAFGLAPYVLGLVIIGERQVGIVVNKFGAHSLSAGRLIALNGEAGYQADTLAPGWYFGYFVWKYKVIKQNVTVIPQGEIGLVLANDGTSIPSERILGKVVDSDNFQSARKFLTNAGEKGRQLGLLTAGTYRINTALFNIITRDTAEANGMQPDDLLVHRVEQDKVGIVTTLDGRPIEAGEIAGSVIPDHDNFQNGQKFLQSGGSRGLQEQILLSGSWNLNPWFARVEQVPMTTIPIGNVGVVISYVGKEHIDVSGKDFKHGDLVDVGHKGVWVTPLYPGKHPINSRVMKVELVPTTNIVLNWADRSESHQLDRNLSSITVRSADGFSFNLDVSQIIHVGALEAPKVISRVAAVQNLVDHVLQPTVGNYFRNSAQNYTVLDFLNARSERQKEAFAHIKEALSIYDVEAIDMLIGDITPPGELMKTQTDRKIAEEQRKTFEVQQLAQAERQRLVRATELADIQQNVVKAEQGVNIADLQAQSDIKRSSGEAEGIRLKAAGEADGIRSIGLAKAEAYRVGAQSLGEQGYTAVQLMQIIGDQGVRVVPDVSVSGGANGGGLTEALLGMLMRKELVARNEADAPKS